MLRALTDRFLALVAAAAAALVLRRWESVGSVPKGRPVLLVATHAGEMMDPVLLAVLCDRTPRFLAKSTLWDIRPIRPFLALTGLLPVQRASDVTTQRDNTATFEAAAACLADGGVVGMFPEGVSHDEPHLVAVKTGAARIALDAASRGAALLQVVPVGITYEDRVALRSRALVAVGRPIDVDPVAPDEDAPQSVRALTAEIEARLREVSADYADADEYATMRAAASVVLRTTLPFHGADIGLVDRERFARALRRAAPTQRQEALQQLGTYLTILAGLNIRDADLVPRMTPSLFVRRWLLAAAGLAALWALLLPGLIVNLVPWTVMLLASGWVRRPATKVTVRLLCAVFLFPMAWVIAAFLGGGSGWWIATQVLFFAATGAFALWAAEGTVNAYRAWRAWRSLRLRRTDLGRIYRRRAAVVTALERAAATADDQTTPAVAASEAAGPWEPEAAANGPVGHASTESNQTRRPGRP